MTATRNKTYKARKAEDTINIIRNILNEKLGILLKETHYQGDGEFYSCRINIANCNINNLNIGTNGKGMTFEYALASAYGEFMERIQNQMLILYRSCTQILFKQENNELLNIINKKNILPKYTYAPDEKIVSIETMMLQVKKITNIDNIELIKQFFGNQPLTVVPFLNVTKGEIEYLPMGILLATSTSNGMCAGNTPQEAIIQGMSEIIERYIIRKIYYENISFPDIPLEHFEGTEIENKIKKILNKYHNLSFQIKDCSCNLGFPAIGVLIIDKVNLKYLFHLGVDPSPITALERTLTEVYQGRFKLKFKQIDFKIQNSLLNDISIKESEMFRTCTSGEGQFPLSLLFGEATYHFSGFDTTWASSDEEDLRKLMGIFKQMNAEVYIRDVSYLGFPAYHVYIPRMSETRKLSFSQNQRMKKAYTTIRNLDNSTNTDVKELLDFIEEDKLLAYSNMKFYNKNDLFSRYNKNLILSILHYYIGNYNLSIDYIDTYLKESDLDNKTKYFFTCIKNIIEFKLFQISDKLLWKVYPSKMLETCFDFLNDRNFLKFLSHSNCFNCSKCNIMNTCQITNVLNIAKKLEHIYEANIPNQDELKSIFTYK